MCGFCTLAGTEVPCGIKGPGSLQADVDAELATEALTVGAGVAAYSIPDDTSTSETISIGGTRDETLEFTGDKDWFRIDLKDGDAIQIDLFGLDHDGSNGLGELVDPYVRIFDASGTELAENDDIDLGTERDSRLVFQAAETGAYYIEVDSYLSEYTGDYRLQVAATAPPPPASPLDAIQTRYVLNTDDPVLVYFAEAGDTYNYNGTTYTATGTNAYEQAQLFSVFEGVEQFLDIDFQITTNRAQADLEWATDTLPTDNGGTLLGFFYFPSFSGNGGYGVLNNNSGSFPRWNSSPGGTLDTGGFMYGVAIHELGHGLGLAHPHDSGAGSDVMQGVSSSSDRGDFGLNQAPFTALSYNEGWDGNPAGFASSVAATGHGATFGALDFAALQDMYGANTTHASGNDVYTLYDSHATGTGAGYYTTWDTGGTDEFRYTGSRDATIDLRAATLQYETGGGGFMSYADGVIAGRTIANGVVIENATGGSGHDTLTGNDADNHLVGNGGNDTLIGRGGNDTLDGGAGNDRLTGSSGIDTFEFEFGDGFDTITDFVLGTDVIDFLGLGIGFADLTITDVSGDARVTYDFTTSGQITLNGVAATGLTDADFLFDVSAPPPPPTGLPQIVGTSGNDNLAGTAAAEEIIGLAGADVLNGRGGNDRMVGGSGDDRHYVDDAGDVVVELAGEGYDRTYGTISFALAANVEAGAARGDGDIDITGNELANWITGNSGSNVLLGGAGADRLISYAGSDSLNGGAGHDILEGGSGPDIFAFDAGSGTDLITDFEVGTDLIDVTSLGIAYADMTIVNSAARAIVLWDDPAAAGARGIIVLDGVQADELLLSSFVTAFGSNQPAILGTSGNDVLFGSQIGDEILGLEGNDRLNGAGGADTLVGGAGDDRYDIDDLGDLIVELAGEGHDIVYTQVDLTLSDNVENARATGGSDTDLTGNDGVNWLTGNTGANHLTGAGGNDRLQGREGSDTIEGGAGNDILEGGTGADVFAFHQGDGTDTVLDYQDGVDRLDLSSLGIGFGDLRIVDSGANALVFYDEADPADRGLIVVTGHSASDMDSSDFVFS